MTASGARSRTAARTAAASVMSRSGGEADDVVAGARGGRVATSGPSIPAAPVTSRRMGVHR